MEKDGFFTTVVGSFPLANTPENMKRAFLDEINVGIDYPCYPQLTSMISQFLTPLSDLVDALELKEDKYYLSGEFNIPKDAIALEYGEFMLNFFKDFPVLKSEVKGTKACLTGPFTLASDIILVDDLAKGIKPFLYKEPRAIQVDWIVDKLAELMKNIGKAYSDMGINIISMDEPMLGLLVSKQTVFHDEDFIVKMLNKAISGISEFSSIHICGNIHPNLRDILLQTDCKIMDHEFRTSPNNFNVFEKQHFEGTDKYLAMGTVETKVVPVKDGTLKDYVESVDFLESYIKNAITKFGKENLVLKPDCGFGSLNYLGETLGHEIAINKLKNMCSVVKSLK